VKYLLSYFSSSRFPCIAVSIAVVALLGGFDKPHDPILDQKGDRFRVQGEGV
jgi:hypothetical protein